MDWYYAINSERRGPVTEETVRNLANSGEIQPTTLVWREGLAQWTSYSEMAGLPGSARRCTECGGAFPETEVLIVGSSVVCADCKPAYLQKVAQGAPTGGAGGVWRRGKELVITADAVLPERCIKCNSSEDVVKVKRKLQWHHPAVYAAFLVNLLLYVIVALITRKRMTVMVGICGRHRARRTLLIWTSFLSFFAGVGMFVWFVASAAQPQDQGLASSPAAIAMLCVAVALIVTSLVAGILARTVFATKIDKQFAKVRGACADYLAGLPEWTGA